MNKTFREQFFDKLNQNPALKTEFDAIIKKHEASKNTEAVAAQFAAFAQSKGFDISPDAVLDALRGPKGEMDEAELEKVSGGGSGLALCIFEVSGLKEDSSPSKNGAPVKTNDGYRSKCGDMGGPLCNWVLCRCWDTSHCANGYHICDEKGKAYPFHAITS